MRSKRELNIEPNPRIKIGEVARVSGVGIEALRFYERSGLLGRPARTESGYRVYAPTVIQRLDFIKRAQLIGFSLEEIKRIIGDKDAGQSPCLEVREIVRQRLQELDERLKEMRRYRRELGDALADWEITGELDGHVCGLIEATNIAHSDPSTHRLVKKEKAITGQAKRRRRSAHD